MQNLKKVKYKDKNISKTLQINRSIHDFTVRRELYLSSRLVQVINSIWNFHTRDLIKRYEENASSPKYVIPHNATLTCNAQRFARARERSDKLISYKTFRAEVNPSQITQCNTHRRPD